MILVTNIDPTLARALPDAGRARCALLDGRLGGRCGLSAAKTHDCKQSQASVSCPACLRGPHSTMSGQAAHQVAVWSGRKARLRLIACCTARASPHRACPPRCARWPRGRAGGPSAHLSPLGPDLLSERCGKPPPKPSPPAPGQALKCGAAWGCEGPEILRAVPEGPQSPITAGPVDAHAACACRSPA